MPVVFDEVTAEVQAPAPAREPEENEAPSPSREIAPGNLRQALERLENRALRLRAD
jgi:hypothetical protein